MFVEKYIFLLFDKILLLITKSLLKMLTIPLATKYFEKQFAFNQTIFLNFKKIAPKKTMDFSVFEYLRSLLFKSETYSQK